MDLVVVIIITKVLLAITGEIMIVEVVAKDPIEPITSANPSAAEWLYHQPSVCNNRD